MKPVNMKHINNAFDITVTIFVVLGVIFVVIVLILGIPWVFCIIMSTILLFCVIYKIIEYKDNKRRIK
jgi:Ca2+/Na+ antiporter